jgi:S-adenosylmethionine:tRNA ribosyltransferase-isomerase
MRVDLFDFDLPEDRIALHPARPRESARLLRVDPGATPPLADATIADLPDLLAPGDVIVVNDTRVIPAALDGVRARGGVSAGVAFNLTRRVDAATWRAFARPAKKLAVGDVVTFAGGALVATVAARLEAGEVVLTFDRAGAALDAAVATVGVVPLPPYIALKRPVGPDDARDYQTIFAARDGAVAAPTAGLHLTPALMDRLAARGIGHAVVTLHVGAGTFLPVKAADTADHTMHAEWGEVTPATAARLTATRARGHRVVAIGTTALRVLESAATADGGIAPFVGETAIFITPGCRVRAVDGLLTNFHLPRSTLFMLVSAFSGLDTMRAAYAHAIATGYRFYSYGDACLLWPHQPESRA